MDKRTKFKVTVITIIGVFVAFLYINRRQILSELKWSYKVARSNREWEKEEPKGQLINGKKNGRWTTFFKNGRLESDENYLNDTLHGRQLIYYPTGQLYIKRTYSKGKEIDSTFWYHDNGQIHIEEFRDSLGRKQGLFKIYYSNGQPSQIAYSKDGKLDGESRSFYDNGQPWDNREYKLGKSVGTRIEFSKAGDTIRVEKY
jgi:antitoxin component YwqK of YwqJK toxin-antitoxin module